MRERLSFFILIAAAIVAVAVIFELGSRWFASPSLDKVIEVPGEDWITIKRDDRLLIWSTAPNLNLDMRGTHGDNKPWHLTTNSLGLRNAPVSSEKNATRILALGDSVTFGLGLSDGETWPAQLEKMLNGDASGRRYEVINGGAIGYSAYQGYRYLKERGVLLQPDIVLAAFRFNDALTASTWRDLDFDPGRDASRFVTLLKKALSRFTEQKALPSAAYPNRLSPGEFIDTLLAMRYFCEERGITLVYVLTPDLPNLRFPGLSDPGYRRIVQEASLQGRVALFDAFEHFKTITGDVFLDTVHLNAEGCVQLARFLCDCLMRCQSQGFDSARFRPECDWGIPHLAKTDPDAALALCRQELLRFNDFSQAYDMMDSLLVQKNDPDKRVAYWREIVEKTPNNGRPMTYLGQACMAKGDLEGAVRWFESALKALPGDGGTLYQLGLALIRKGDYVAGVQHVHSIIKRNPGANDVRKALVQTLVETGHLDVAWEELHKAEAVGTVIPKDIIERLVRESGRDK